MKSFTIYCDGGYDRDGEGYGSFQVLNERKELVFRHKFKLETDGPLESEYRAMIAALNFIPKKQREHVNIFTDCNTLVRQIITRRASKRFWPFLKYATRVLSTYRTWNIRWNSRVVNVEKFGH